MRLLYNRFLKSISANVRGVYTFIENNRIVPLEGIYSNHIVKMPKINIKPAGNLKTFFTNKWRIVLSFRVLQSALS